MTAVDASKYPDWAFQQAGTSKFVWQILPIVLLFLCGIAGGVMGLIWFSSSAMQCAPAAGGPRLTYGAPPGGTARTASATPPPPPPPPPATAAAGAAAVASRSS